jgi:hypothetical protein
MRKGDHVPLHRDQVTGKRHYRLNTVLWRPQAGGLFLGGLNMSHKRVVFFRPDILEHRVSPCTGLRIVLSIGWAI